MGPLKIRGLGTITHNEQNTIYINESGLYDIMLYSKKEEAKKFKKLITGDVLPSLRKYGKYEIKKSTMKSYYDENTIYQFKGKNVMYVAYLEIVNEVPMYKFGKTDEIYRRYKEHLKTIPNFTIIYIEETDNKDEVEDLFKTELSAKSLLQKYKFEKKLTTDIELFTTMGPNDKVYEIKDILKIY